MEDEKNPTSTDIDSGSSGPPKKTSGSGSGHSSPLPSRAACSPEKVASVCSSSLPIENRTSSPSGGSSAFSPPRSPFDVRSSPEAIGIERLQKMILAHEIALNQNFRLPDMSSPPPPNTLEAQIRETVHQAFWGALQKSLSQDPPNYSHAMVLLQEIRETLLSFLPHNHNSPLHDMIESNLDMAHIRNRAELGVLDMREVASFIIDTMGKLCAPARDDEIRQLRLIEDAVPLFREVFRVLEAMKVDMLNFTLSQVKPLIDQHAIQYEQQMFDEFLATQPEPLYLTKQWIEQTAVDLLSQIAIQPSLDSAAFTNGSTSPWKISPTKLLLAAFVNLLDGPVEVWPETLMADISRIAAVQHACEVALSTASVMLITWNVLGGTLSAVPDFKSRLKDEITVLLEAQPVLDEQLALQIYEHLEAKVAEAIVVEQSAKVHGDLKVQIIALCSINHPLRKLLRKRLKEFASSVLTSSSQGVPAGLTVVESDIMQSIGMFGRVVSRNQLVFGRHYSQIIAALAGELSLKHPNQDRSGTPVSGDL